MKAPVPNRAYLNDFERFVLRFEPNGSLDFTLELPTGLFSVHPLATTMIAAAAAAAKDAGGAVHVNGLVANPSTRYLERIGLFDAIGVASGFTVQAHEEAGRFIPIRQVRSNDELNDFIVEVQPLLHTTPDQAAPVKYALFELVRNVLEHAGTAEGAFVAAQIASSSGRLLIGVADAGIGIRHSLGRSHPTTSDQAAIALAMRPGVTGVTRRVGGDDTNGGAGLFILKAMAHVAGHHMVVISGDAMFKLLTVPQARRHLVKTKVANDRVTWRQLPIPWSGTAVGIDVTLGDERMLNSLLRLVRSLYDIDVSQAKKEYKRARFGRPARG